MSTVRTSAAGAWAAAVILVAFFAMLTVGMVSCASTPCQGMTPKTIATHADGRVDVVCP
jgi:hypothetical protein